MHHWMIQKSPFRETCHRCAAVILPGVEYFRATFSPDDGLDEFGYNVCERCRWQCKSDEPPPK